MRRMTGKTITGEVSLILVWKRLKEIEDILGDNYDLERLKHLVTGDTFTEEDMGAAYMAGYETGMKQGKEAELAPVVRCRDCTQWQKATVNSEGYLICPASGMKIMATDFCSKAERRLADG